MNTNPAEVRKELKEVDYPASNQDLDYVNNSGKNNDVPNLLKAIPTKNYNSPVEVRKAVGKLN